MIKPEFLRRLTLRLRKYTEKEVKGFVDVILEGMSEPLARGERLEIRGFGSFTPKYRAARKARNPKTGSTTLASARYDLVFKPGKVLKKKVDAGFNK